MKNEIADACIKCQNEINECLTDFEKTYQSLQKRLNSYFEEKNKHTLLVDYDIIYHLRKEVSNKINSLQNEIIETIEKIIK